jgi:O-antigen/teichoic acid export membrane protein
MVLKNIVWQLFEKIVRLTLTVFVSALLARYLGPNGFGQYNFLNAIISIALVVTSLGFNRILVREATGCKDNNDHIELISTAFYLRLLASIVVFIVMSVFFINTDAQNGLVYTIALASVIFVSFDVIDYHLQGQSIFKIATSCRVISFLIASALRVYLVIIESNISYFYATILVEYAIAGLLLYLVAKFRYSDIANISSKKINFSKARKLLSESWPEIFAGFGAIVFMKMDQIMLQYMLGPSSVGIYSAATRISEAWYFLPTAIVAATFPVFMKKYNQDKQNQESLIQDLGYVMSILVWLSIFAGIAISVLGDRVIDLLFGHEYSKSGDILKLHVWGGIFLCMGITSGSWLVAQKKLKLNLYRNLSGLVLNFVLNIILIPVYGVTGAAVATVSGLALAFLFFDLIHKELRKMFFIKILAFSPFQLIKSIKFFLNMK